MATVSILEYIFSHKYHHLIKLTNKSDKKYNIRKKGGPKTKKYFYSD